MKQAKDMGVKKIKTIGLWGASLEHPHPDWHHPRGPSDFLIGRY